MPGSRGNERLTSNASILEWDRRLDEFDYYELLNVSQTATDQERLDAYHRFALVFHPDAHPGSSDELRQALTRIFQRGVEAHLVLSNEALHARYRTCLARGERRLLEDRRRRSVDLNQVLPSLHEQCRSAGAKLEAQQAARAWSRGELDGVERRLLSALRYDGNANPDVAQCLDALSSQRRDGA